MVNNMGKYYYGYGMTTSAFWKIARMFYRNPSNTILYCKLNGYKKMVQRLQQKLK
jgi:hypothetical protein